MKKLNRDPKRREAARRLKRRAIKKIIRDTEKRGAYEEAEHLTSKVELE